MKTAQDGLNGITGTKNTGKYAALDFAIKNADEMPMALLTQNTKAIAEISPIIGVGGTLANRIGNETIKRAQEDNLKVTETMSIADQRQQIKDNANRNTWEVLLEAKDMVGSSAISDNQIINARAFPFLVAGGGEAIKGGKVLLKLAPEAADIFRLATTTEKLGDLFKFAKDAKITGPESLFSGTGIGDALATSLSGSTRASSALFVPVVETGAIAKIAKADVKVTDVATLTRDFSKIDNTPVLANTFVEKIRKTNQFSWN